MKNTLIISDCHFPYQHKDTFKFLKAANEAYGCEQHKHTGDVVDNHTSSYHEIEWGSLGAKEEHKRAYKAVQKLSELFPTMDVVLGNHDALPKRKAKTAGIPEARLRSYNDVYDTKWVWRDKFYFPVSNGTSCLLVHTMGTNTLLNAQRHSHHSIQGHHHGKFGIEYFADTEVLRWSMTVGCLIDPSSPAFNYASGATVNRPILGCGAIIEDSPILIPMTLTKSGNWNNKI